MTTRTLAVGVMVLVCGGCSAFGPGDAPSIAGRYDLVTVDGEALPCCTRMDSTGARVTVIGGTLTLGAARPEPFGATPAGMRPISCVHEVPNGAHVDTSGTVTLPDSSTYELPECGDGTYTMVITRRFDYADGTSHTVTATSSGRYAWSAGEPGIVSLLGAGLMGPVAMSTSGVDVKVQDQHFGMGPEPSDPQYEFFHATR